jgi:hypothetical protein
MQESRALARAVVYEDGIRLAAGTASVNMIVLRDRWRQHRTDGRLIRDLLEVRVLRVSRGPAEVVVSRNARAIAAGVTRDFAPQGKTA